MNLVKFQSSHIYKCKKHHIKSDQNNLSLTMAISKCIEKNYKKHDIDSLVFQQPLASVGNS